MKEQIRKAITAHGNWKVRLEKAIETGQIDIPIATIKADNQCEFGKWLYDGATTLDGSHQDRYERVKALHAQFHQVAGNIAELATAGQTGAAEQLMSGDYTATSSRLTEEMVNWEAAV